MESGASKWFERFRTNGFKPNPEAAPEVEFARLAERMKWQPGTNAYERHHSELMLATGQARPEVKVDGILGDLLKYAAQAYSQHAQQVRKARKADKPASWFDHFRKDGFEHNVNDSFESEFLRLAKSLGWWGSNAKCTRMAEDARDYYAGYEEYPKLNTLTGYMPPKDDFEYVQTNSLEIEFDRLAERMSMEKDSAQYQERLQAARLRDEKIRNVDLTKLAMFKKYSEVIKFKLNPNSHIDVQFGRLVEHGQWGEKKAISRWQSLLSEAVLLAGLTEDTQGQQSVASTNMKKVKSRSVSAQSQTSGVKLNAQSLSGYQTSTFTPTHSEYTPALSTSSYFSSFAGRGFTPAPSEPLEAEFARLSVHEGWTPGNPEYVKQWRNALESELEAQFGASNKLASWQALCVELGIDPPPPSISQCKKALKTKHVSIKSLIDARREMIKQGKVEIMNIGVQLPSFIMTNTMAQMPMVPKTSVKVFATVKELREYCRKNKGFFPKVDAKKDGFLKALLRRLVN